MMEIRALHYHLDNVLRIYVGDEPHRAILSGTIRRGQVSRIRSAILFADILLPLEPMGAPFEFAKGEGPVIHDPVRTPDQVEKLRVCDPHEGLGYVLDAIRIIRRELDGKTPLIGFAGAPFTLASYLIEGGKSSHYAITKRMMYREPVLWRSLMEKLAAQVGANAGAKAVFGEPIARDGHTVVPVAQSMWGSGAGTGESDEDGSGSGGGGGAMTRPVGYIHLTDDGATYDGLLPFVGGDPSVLNDAYWDRVEHFLGKCGA